MAALKLVSVAMGYGHLRAAEALSQELGLPIELADERPLATGPDARIWQGARVWYERMSRVSQLGGWAAPVRGLLRNITAIPHLHPLRDLSAPTLGVRKLLGYIDQGMGHGLVKTLKADGSGLLTTFYAPAIIADAAGIRPVYCVVTDADVNRIWTPADSGRSEIEFLVPSLRAKARLQSYGVRPERVHFTGFPLPGELLGGPGLPAARAALGERLVRLDPTGTFRESYRDELQHFLGALPEKSSGPPLVTFAIGGAGSQGPLGHTLLKSFRRDIIAGRLRFALVAATHASLAGRFHEWVHDLKLDGLLGAGVRILFEPETPGYFRKFNRLLAETDVLFTKPSELTFFAALGLPLVFSWPVGVHERYNRRWAIEGGAGLKQHDPKFASEWIQEWLLDGTLAGAAWAGFMRLPKFGLYRIAEAIRSSRSLKGDEGRRAFEGGRARIGDD